MNSTSAPSMSKNRRYCLTSAFRGSVMILTRASTSSGMSGQITGSRPMNSGIMPNSSRSSEVTLPSSSPRSVCCSACDWLPKPMVLRPTRRAMMCLEPGEGAAADEQDVGRVHLDVLLLGMLAAALRRDVGHGAFEHLQEGLLHAFAGDVASDRDVVRGLADLVDFIDVDDAALGGFEVEVGGVQQLEQDVLDVFADVAGLGQAWSRRRWRKERSRRAPGFAPAGSCRSRSGPINRMLDLSSSTSVSGSSPWTSRL